ncbi:membrane protein [Lacinutrix sp. Hel_I_90]|uniref:membrane protein n=1 Tax=Lacinutrix sp. Hel_I_90 TaxID=1249999 RepID=UPI0005C9DD03|nr:membrane protein [Lacinutrix sp. Hel_I_90]
MLKKIGLFIVIIIAVFLILLYWSLSSTDKAFKTVEIIGIDNIKTVDFRALDSVLLAASTLYEAGEIKRLMQGEQYREAWETPIKVPVLFLDSLKGGVEILKQGGGKQTQSLRLKSEKGVEYTIRSINKDPKALIPDFAKTLGLENIIVDGISAQHPYGAVLAAELAKHASVLSTHPKIVFVPKQKALGKHNKKYGNRLFLLEYETNSDENWTDLKNVTEIIATDDLQKLKLEFGKTIAIDTAALIRARLFDLLIGDWDRHAKQWGWIIQKRNGNYSAIPIPGDRDNAFFNTEGIIPTLLSNENIVPELRPFTKEINYMPGLVYPFDRYFLYHIPEVLFVKEAEILQQRLTDKVLNDALKVWPKEISELDGKAIIEKIKTRREALIEYAKAFKKIIDKKGTLKEPLKGSKTLNLPDYLIRCFECE